MNFSKMCSAYDTYFEYLFSGKSLTSDKDVIDLIIKNDLMYHNDYISKPIYKRTEKHLIECLKIIKKKLDF